MIDLFRNIVSDDKLNPKFKLLQTAKQLNPAKLLIEEIAIEMEDNDGNFIEQFQTTGFLSRLWEIFLFKFFKENGFSFDTTKNRPDFNVKKNGINFFVEASLSNEIVEEKFTKKYIHNAEINNDLNAQEELIEHYVMRMGSVLYSKLKKRYWELEWVKGKPLVLAITPAHNYLSSFLPDAKIIEYLYGISYDSLDKENEPVKVVRTETHKLGEKEIPPNFFQLPETENISAVIFTNNSDIHKFNRMGYQSGISKEFIIMERAGFVFEAKLSDYPAEFSQSIIPGDIKEDWNEAVCIFHNPKALIPLSRDLIKNVRQTWIDENGDLEGTMPSFYPFNSKTLCASLI
ncbi:hypothetical protein [Flavobacterium crassostreae]|uniref:Glycosaminoglycan attachment site n=1 Tax=Flavobacterium crassostreae TaxID=1763534 RepID=A0A1B9DH95_9FLAO|nr:hypothetical protein [Flavobacterium crassostreae]OCB69009.1 hypothetical protein LPBF_12540 [Flavobacterium crassostreae]